MSEKTKTLERFAREETCLHCLVSDVLNAWERTHPEMCGWHVLHALGEVMGDVMASASPDLRLRLSHDLIERLPDVILERMKMYDKIEGRDVETPRH